MDEDQKSEHYEVDLDELDRQREAMRQKMQGHNWKQQGQQVSCTSCPFHHSFFIPPGTFLTGIDDVGNPILKKEY